jgi:hypothetical protein
VCAGDIEDRRRREGLRNVPDRWPSGSREAGRRSDTETAGEALNHFRAAQNHFAAVLIIAADGQEIDGFELNRQYQAEQRSSYE